MNSASGALGHPIAKGTDLAPLIAELMGRRTGVGKGKGGSMHLADFKVGRGDSNRRVAT
jgi:TPP-dependent pyruvate/acetoin dehydrogenase alpha subunit